MTIFRRDEVVGHAYVKHGIRVQYAVVSIAVYGRLQHIAKTWSGPLMAWTLSIHRLLRRSSKT